MVYELKIWLTKHSKCVCGSSEPHKILALWFVFTVHHYSSQITELSCKCLSKNQAQFRSLVHHTSPPMCCRWDGSLFPYVAGAMIEWYYFSLRELVFFSLFSTPFSIFFVHDQYLLVGTFFLHIFYPPSVRNSKCFCVFVNHL